MNVVVNVAVTVSGRLEDGETVGEEQAGEPVVDEGMV